MYLWRKSVETIGGLWEKVVVQDAFYVLMDTKQPGCWDSVGSLNLDSDVIVVQEKYLRFGEAEFKGKVLTV